ncbi:hypothetical protein [Chryseobacterium sp. ISL-6]|uniref:hypothetical protein n=1 Tax=Chryseobacterium sp. ISL-6 TaxID=2819143 RepID=UPI001BE693DF|nr:hypothetical protein [Chryseobacterium sp. ISL-6]MBT2623786.1 hypothetical protein [Chryseobacterium sp. ISL-6]
MIISCQIRKSDHTAYLNRVNEIDNIYRIKSDTLTALKMYQNLFKKYPPHNSHLINEYQTYIIISDKYNLDFGGKESLYKLIPLVAPNWKYNRLDKDLFDLYKKYGIDSLEVENKVADWKKGLNKKLVDSFSIAFFRNQEFRMPKYIEKQQSINDAKNAKLFVWTFSNYGFPSLQKIGLWGNDNIFMPMGNMLNHMAGLDNKNYPYFKEKVFEYMKKGECTPEAYAEMIDKRAYMEGKDCVYCTVRNSRVSDSVQVNKNRYEIGMPSLKHSKRINADYLKR